ncbi:DNA repair protein complementing XP-C cells homolog [Anticarsia gemmatalis]|uniref:DNA repair protein complementing XP-C cells homolog n=1 Tax=Anticarsia gemmatalis TaxID=129554 RepID=UPI003F75DE38
MPTTRKKVIKTVYKDENSDEEEGGDFSDSGSEAKISEASSSEEEDIASEHSSGDEFDQKSSGRAPSRKCPPKKPKFTKTLMKKLSKQMSAGGEVENPEPSPALFSIKDLTEADKLLPPILNLSESDSSDDEESPPKTSNKSHTSSLQLTKQSHDSDNEANTEYKDVWSNNMQDDSEEIAKKTFMELEQHKSKIEETKATLQNYTLKMQTQESDVKDLLALGEEASPKQEPGVITKKPKFKRRKNDSDSEMEDWEEVQETKTIPQQGIQLFVEFPEAGCRKSKKVDVEMMMKRKINRVKKEYQVYMHKVHVLCWLGHGNYVSRVLNDQELMAAALSLVPSKECYPGERVDMKYVEQITTWYKDKLTLKQDKNEDKFKPKAPPLKTILLDLIKRRIVTSKKYLVLIFVAMLRALGLQCRIMFNFVTLPIKPPATELCSLATKPKGEKTADTSQSKTAVEKSKATPKPKAAVEKKDKQEPKASTSKSKPKKQKIAQVDGNYDSCSSDEDMEVDWRDDFLGKDYGNIMQVDGNDDAPSGRSMRSTKRPKADATGKLEEEDVSPPKIPRKMTGRRSPKPPAKATPIEDKVVEPNKRSQRGKKTVVADEKPVTGDNNPKPNSTNAKAPSRSSARNQKPQVESDNSSSQKENKSTDNKKAASTNSRSRAVKNTDTSNSTDKKVDVPKITVTDENKKDVASKYFEDTKPTPKLSRLSRKRSQTTNPGSSNSTTKVEEKETIEKPKSRTKSAPGTAVEKSKYFETVKTEKVTPKRQPRKVKEQLEDRQRVSHRDLGKNSNKKPQMDITGDLVDLIKGRVKDAKIEAKKGLVKEKIKKESDEDSDYLPVEDPKRNNSDSDDDFKPVKISPKPSTSRRLDRRVISSSVDEPIKKNKIDVWCEIYVEELEQWISVDVIKGKIHSTGDLYSNATHPVCYIVGWDNNNYLKDLTRKYVPQYNTVTRKQRAEPLWWDKAIKPYLGPKTARDREEDEYLDRMQLEAPLPKSIAEYKNHPLYALKRHLLKFEAIYPPDAAVLGFVRGEPVYARDCVYVCRSRDTWLKEAKVVKLAQEPYKVVKARPKWDKLSNKLITDKPLEVFGPWQVQDYEPPVAENGLVPRNAYGNVELFKECMLPKGTVHIKLPGLNRVAKKLNIDCAPAMTGFDFNGGWSHPVYDGFVVCQEFEEIIVDAWTKDQEEQERRELEKTEMRVYGNWRRLIKSLLIRERLKLKYGFEEPSTSETGKGKAKGPRLVVKKKS